MLISDIGNAGDDTALLCHTNHPADTPSGTDAIHSGGQWFRPDQTEVMSSSSSEGFRRNRGSMVVRLYRNTVSTHPPVEGIYCCEIQDDTNTLQRVFVGLYYANDRRGNIS